MRTARPAISGNHLASIAKFECPNFSNFRLCHAILLIYSICSHVVSFKNFLEYVLVLLIRKTATFSKCNGVFFGVEIGMVKLRKSNILAPKHGGDGVILASLVAMTCAVHIIQVSGSYRYAAHFIAEYITNSFRPILLCQKDLLLAGFEDVSSFLNQLKLKII